MTSKREVALYALASGAAMGQQTYERHLADGLPSVLGDDWLLRIETVRTLRSSLPGTTRVPLLLNRNRAALARRVAGAYLTRRRATLHHRLDLRLPPLRRPEILTVHDLAPWSFHDEGSVPLDAEASFRRAAAIVAPSHFSAAELNERFGLQNVRVIPNGVPNDLFLHPPLSSEELTALGIDRPFVLHAGGATARKNLKSLAAAWSREVARRTDALLVLCGPESPHRSSLFAGSPRTLLQSFVDRRVLIGLMKRAACIVVPSLYEGFGIPALEAMALGVPAVVARTSALIEVCGDAAVMVEPTPEGLAHGLLRVVGEAPIPEMIERGEVQAQKYSWTASLQAYASLYEELVG